MAGVSRGGSMRAGGRGRRSMAEINVVPYIDVMLVLLVIFMVTAPLVTPGTVDLPSVAQSSNAPTSFVEIMIKKDGSMEVAVRGKNAQPAQKVATARDVLPIVQQQQALDPANPAPVIISADKTIQYDLVMKVMSALQDNHVKRVGLSVKPGERAQN